MNILFRKQSRLVLTLLTLLIIFHVPSFTELGAFPDFEWIINNGPVFTAGDDPTRTIAENTAAGQNIGTPVAATDADGDTLTYTLSGTDAAAFRIVSSTGQLQTKAALDYETKASYTVTVSVSDGNGGSDSITLTVNVTDANDVPIFTEGSRTSRTVAENTPANTNIGTALAATDADGDTLTYRLGGTDSASFGILSTSGQLQTKAALDFETQSTYTVVVSVSDGEDGGDSIAVTITVTDVDETPDNNAPVFTDGTTTTRAVAENTPPGRNIGHPIAATDTDNDTLTYTLSGTDAASFSIVSTTGQLRTQAPLDYENKSSYTVTVSVSDGKGGSDRITVTINVTDVNERPPRTPNRAPVFAEGTTTTRTVPETAPSNANIGASITATDADSDTLTYTLDGNTDAASFRIVSTTGQLRTRAPLDYETKTAYTVTVSVSDGEGGSDSITVTITVTDVNERPPRTPNRAPVFTEGDSTTRTVPETAPINANIGASITATDADNDTLTYTLGGNTDAAAFSIDSTTGQLRTSAALDYETKTSYTVTVSVSDGKGGSDTITVTVSVRDVAELPDGMTPIRQRTPQVRDAIVAAAGVRSPDDVTAAHLAAITHLPLQRRGITALKSGDFDGLTALKELHISNNSIHDISPLAGLTTLTKLYMYSNRIRDISLLENLTKLTNLSMGYNLISDISPLENLTNLTWLSMHSNSLIRDISPLADLTKLTNLSLSGHFIRDISPLADLTNLTKLHLSGTSISDISTLENLTKLTWLELHYNSIRDISPLENLTKLTHLYLHYNSIRDISALENLTKLTTLKLDGNSLSDISALDGLTNLTYLNLKYTSIRDISALDGLTKLTHLILRNNSIRDISALDGLTNLKWLELHHNSIRDVSALEGLTNLKYLDLRNNPISDYGPLRRLKTANPGVDIDINLNNNPPQFTEGDTTTRTVVENTATGTDIGTPVTATDADNHTLTYSLSGTDAESFRVVETSGQLRTKAALDFETKNAYTVTLTVYDGNSGGDSITVTITVTDVAGAAPSVETSPIIPDKTHLLSNFPNPFNPETWIPYHLAKDAEVTLTIYDVRGSVVRVLVLGHQPAGVYESRGRAAYWDGKNQLGESVASGLYFYTLTAGEFTATRKLLIAK